MKTRNGEKILGWADFGGKGHFTVVIERGGGDVTCVYGSDHAGYITRNPF